MSQLLDVQHSLESLRLDKKPKICPIDENGPSGRPRYPDLPDNAGASPNFYVLGWAVTEEQLKELVRRSYAHPERLRRGFGDIASTVIIRLQYFFKYFYIWYHPALPDGTSIPEPDTEVSVQPVIAISFTASRFLFHRRPTQAQYDWFVASLVRSCVGLGIRCQGRVFTNMLSIRDSYVHTTIQQIQCRHIPYSSRRHNHNIENLIEITEMSAHSPKRPSRDIVSVRELTSITSH
ncbi:hypothetical protein B0H21DRAFT_813966 [Amylocystis lapponica]|nr:hypothetical protein B0H21DRAFT_813966 [Amylocystis lapponica]